MWKKRLCRKQTSHGDQSFSFSNFYLFSIQETISKTLTFIFTHIAENLRKEVNINVCRQLVYMVNIFSELPPNILSDVLGHLKPEVYLPNDVIIKAGTIGDCMYFLASGTVAVYTPSGREVKKEDSSFSYRIVHILQ